jgi:MSHA pilin protein MshA
MDSTTMRYMQGKHMECSVRFGRGSRGFTLIELVIVIILLSVLSVTALPRFVDLQDDARAAAVQGVVGAVNAAAAINYGAYQLSPGRATQISGTAFACRTLITGNAGLTGQSLPTTMQIASEATCGTALSAGQSATCVIQDKNKTYISAAATVICTG